MQTPQVDLSRYIHEDLYLHLMSWHAYLMINSTTLTKQLCKTSPRTSAIVHFIFHFWSFEISERILRNQKLMIGLDSYSRQFIYLFGPHLDIYIYQSLNRLPIRNSSCVCCKVITGSLMRIRYLKLRSMAHLLSLECAHCS